MRTTNIIALIGTFMLICGTTFGQGEGLFKQKCNTCHMVDKASTGPWLKGVKQKWADAGEAELLYKWVTNSPALISSGQSKMAAAIKGFSASEMPPQIATNEEIDAILTYIDGYTAPTPVVDSTGTANGVTGTVVPDYEGNLVVFYWLFGFMILMIFVIIIMSNTIINFVRSDFFKTKLKEQQENKSLLGIVLLVGALGAMALTNNSYALHFVGPGETTEKTPWLLVERMDLYLMLAADVLLVFVVLYLRGLFSTFLHMVSPKREKVKPERVRKITKVLTDTVAIEDEASILMDHEYDGIQELDNNLPPWWVWGFYATIVFAIFYLFSFHFFKTGDLQEVEYKREMAKAEKEVNAYLDKMAMNVDENTATLLTDDAAIQSGKSIFTENCVTCHKQNGQGDIGPNLTDKFWIYGNDIKQVFGTIKNGTAKGMPDHASKLNPVQIQQVASFVLQLPYTAGRAPDGTEVK